MVNTKRSIKEIDGSEIVSTIRIGMSFGEDEDHDVVLHMTSQMMEFIMNMKQKHEL